MATSNKMSAEELWERYFRNKSDVIWALDYTNEAPRVGPTERAQIIATLKEMEPRSTKIQRGIAESWKAEGAREQFDKMMKALGE